MGLLYAFRPLLTPLAVLAAFLALAVAPSLAQGPTPEPEATPAPAAAPAPASPAPGPRAPPRRSIPAAAAPPSAPAPVPAAAPRPGARLAPGQAIPFPDLEAFVDGAVREAMAAGHVAGVAVAVVQNGQVVLEKGYGLSRVRPQAPVDPSQTLFRLGSVSKTFTWLAVLKQAEAGRINLDQPVNAYLPVPLRVPDENFPEQVKVRQLMDHSAGFEDRELGRLFKADPRAFMGLDEALQNPRPHRVRAAGELSTYSNYGAALAGAAAAQVAGRPFEDMIETEVLRPMELADTTFRQPYPEIAGLPAPMPAAQAARLSESFLWTPRGRRVLPTELVGLAPAAGASSSASDMARYMLVLLGGGKTELGEAYGPETARRIRTNLSRSAPGLDGWAYGFREYGLPGGFRGFGHDGATLGFRTGLIVVPELGLGVFVAGNTDVWLDTPAYVVHPQLGKWLIAGGEHLFGMNSFGWRFSAVVFGTILIIATIRMARRLSRSTLVGAMAGLFLTVDGLSFVMSRIALLDIFQAAFTVMAVACVVADRDWLRHKLAQHLRARGLPDLGGRLGPLLLWRPWRVAAGVLFGLA
ncbi:MAG: hypothetical protein B7Y99_12885, partial [Caulobacterales bacterium 32-69-10]